MFQVIAAILGIADNSNKGAQQQLLNQQTLDENSIAYTRYLNANAYERQKTLTVVAGIGIIALIVGVIVVAVIKRKK